MKSNLGGGGMDKLDEIEFWTEKAVKLLARGEYKDALDAMEEVLTLIRETKNKKGGDSNV